jgi:hypothetical protein
LPPSCRFTGEAYELNTYDDCPTAQLAADSLEASLQPGLLKRLLQGYEARRDILAGKAVSHPPHQMRLRAGGCWPRPDSSQLAQCFCDEVLDCSMATMHVACALAVTQLSTTFAVYHGGSHVLGGLPLLLLLVPPQVDVFITPDGGVLKSTQPAGATQRRLPPSLLKHWNE